LNSGKKSPHAGYGLTDVEKDIVRMFVEGSTLRSISETLTLDSPTVNSHLIEIQKKLDVKTRSGIVMKAQREKVF
jgi:DNA-binding CsgD family transcriptional regulator